MSGQFLLSTTNLFYMFLYLIVVLIIAQILFKHSFKQLGIFRIDKTTISLFIWIILFIVVSLELNQKFYNYHIENEFFIMLFLSNAIIAVVEELINRALITEYLMRIHKSPLIVIVISATLFSTIHIYGKVFSVNIALSTIITTFIMGTILGIYYFYSRNILICMIIHLSNNLIVDMIEGDMKYICYFIYLILVLKHLILTVLKEKSIRTKGEKR